MHRKKVSISLLMLKILLSVNNKPSMTSSLRNAIMKRSRLKNKANNSCKLAVKTAYNKHKRNLVVKLNEEVKKIFLKKVLSLKNVFIINKKLLLKLKVM